MTERRERAMKKKKKLYKTILALAIAVACIICVFFACKVFTSDNPVPIVYEKNGMLFVKNDREDDPFIVSQNYTGGSTALIEDGEGLLYTDALGALCYSKIKTADSAKETNVLAENVFFFLAADDNHIYYIKDDVLYENNRKGEKELATGVTDYVATEDGRFLFFNTETDLFGIHVEEDGAPVRIAENVSVYNLIRTVNDWELDSENLYYIANGKLAHLHEDLTETVLCENAAIGFILDETVFAITETQIGEDEFKSALVMYVEDEAKAITDDILGSEAVSQIYPDKTYMLFTKASDKNETGEAYYTLDAKGNFRYLCENENYMNLFADAEGKKAYIHTADGDLLEYKLTKNAELKVDSEKKILSGVQSAYAVKDHIGITGDNLFGIYHNNKYEDVYNDGAPHYPKLLVEDGKAYICDQAGAAPFYICRGGKLHEIDDAVTNYAILSDTRVVYLKATDTNGEVYDLYKIDKTKEPVLIDSGITTLH